MPRQTLFVPCTKFLQRTWKTTNLYVGFDPYLGVTILISDFFSLCILISRVGAICRKIILFSSSLRADTWFWSIHSSHDPLGREIQSCLWSNWSRWLKVLPTPKNGGHKLSTSGLVGNLNEFLPRYGIAKILTFSRKWLGLFWLVLDHKNTHQQQIAEICPVRF